MSTEDKTESLSTLLNQRYLKIPQYQRGYAWQQEQFEDFTHDLERSTDERRSTDENSLPTHYLGTIVLKHIRTDEESGYDVYELTDGQQRIATAMLTAEALSSAIDAHAPRVDEGRETLKDVRWTNEDTLVHEHIRKKRYRDYYLELGENDHTVFEQLLSGADPKSINTTTHSQQRLCNAKSHLDEWLTRKSEDLSDEEYANFLVEASKALRNNFRVIPYFVQTDTEAGLMFELVNDRGKDLTTLDKIKSHLVYCASRYDDGKLARHIESEFSEAYEHLGDIDDSDVVSSFTSDFWIAFSGERNFRDGSGNTYGRENINRRIKDSRHAPFEDEKKFRDWTDAFLSSLVGLAEAYAMLHNPDAIPTHEDDSSEVRNTIVRKFKSITYLNVSSNFDSLLMAGYHNLGVSQEFVDLIDACEKFSFRAYNICNKPTDTGRSRIERAAHDIEWAGHPDRYEQVFDKEPSRDLSTSKTTVRNTISRIQQHTKRHAPINVVREYLRLDDVRDGDEDEDWSGVRSDKVLKYIFFKVERTEYEPEFGDSRGPADLFEDLYPDESNSTTLEHIHPDHSEDISETIARDDEDETTLDDLVDSLANLTILHQSANSIVQDMDYETKYEDVYTDYKLKQVTDLPRRWDIERLRGRREDLLDIIKDFAEF